MRNSAYKLCNSNECIACASAHMTATVMCVCVECVMHGSASGVSVEDIVDGIGI